MRILPHLTRPRPPGTLIRLVALGLARSGGPWWLAFRVVLVVLAVAVLDGVDMYLDLHPAAVAR